MKLIFLFLVIFVSVQATVVTDTRDTDNTRNAYGNTDEYRQRNTRPVDKQTLTRQRDVLRLMRHITFQNVNNDQVTIGRDFNVERNLDRFDNKQEVREAVNTLNNRRLRRNEVFSVDNVNHVREVIALFRVFYNARDYDTFYRTACWARDHINPGTFVHAMTVAMRQRQDTRDINMPPRYEVYPFFFFNTDVIDRAQQINNEYRQQTTENFVIRSNYTNTYTDVNRENTLSYFTNDVELNEFYYNLYVNYPFWERRNNENTNNQRRGEFLYYTNQQLLARYNLERFSNNMGNVPRFQFNRLIRTGYTPAIRHHSGVDMPARPNDFYVDTENNKYDVQNVHDYNRRLRDAVDYGFVVTEDGKTDSLRNPEDIERLANMVAGNNNSPNRRLYNRRGVVSAHRVLGNVQNVVDDTSETRPSSLVEPETTLRDPIFYQLLKDRIRNVYRFKETLRPYTREEVAFPGVRVENVDVDKMVTYFEYRDTDVTNCVNPGFKQVIVARQARLNHEPFNVRINVNSDKVTRAVVRIFLGPKYDSMNREIDLNNNRYNFFEIDRFTQDLTNGRNTIVRNSRQFTLSVEDRTPTRETLNRITNCINTNQECTVETNDRYPRFPNRLLLPVGRINGLPFQVLVSVTPVRNAGNFVRNTVQTNDNVRENVNDRTYVNDVRFVDDNAFGYPLDRRIDTVAFQTENIYVRDVKIYYKVVESNDMRRFDQRNVYENNDSRF